MQNLSVNDKNLAIEGKNLYRYRALKGGEKNEKKNRNLPRKRKISQKARIREKVEMALDRKLVNAIKS